MGISIANQHAEEEPNTTRSLGRKSTSNVHERVEDIAVIYLLKMFDETIILQFRKFLERLEQEVKNKDVYLDSKELIELFLKKERELYKEIEIVYIAFASLSRKKLPLVK